MNNDSVEKKLKEVLSSVLDIKVEDINEETSINTEESWDSLAHIRIILEIEREFGIKIPTDKIFSLNSFNALIKFIKR